MGSPIYSKLLPALGDLDNRTGTEPGYRVFVMEIDGGIALELVHANEDPATSKGSSVFLNVEEAQELLQGLKNAIDRAEPKNANHPARGSDC